jgi:peptidoglycan/xylan/chitin deacetylase (PgdA/CDA1 family)
MYHMVRETNDPREKRYCCSHRNFGRQMAYLKKAGYQIIRLDDLVNLIISTNKTNQTNKTSQINQLVKPHKSVVITFDDGYMDNYENALPILREYNFPATVFVVSSLVGKTNNWMRADGYPERPLMGWHEIEEMKGSGFTIGSHSVNHCHLSHLSLEDAKREIEDSKTFLEDKLRIPMSHFAYPHGDMNKSIVNMVKEVGYRTACSTKSGFNSDGINLFELRRIEICGTDSIWQFAIKLTYGTNDGNLLLPTKYYLRRFSEKINNLLTQ